MLETIVRTWVNENAYIAQESIVFKISEDNDC